MVSKKFILLSAFFLLISLSIALAVNEFSFSYTKGWNLISLPSSWTLRSISNSLVTNSCSVGIAYSFDSRIGWQILKPEEYLLVGSGYVINVDNNCVFPSSYGGGSFEYSSVLNKGWNLIGSSFKEYDLDKMKGNCDVDALVKYDPASRGYVSTTKLKPGEGYWIYYSGSGNCTFASVANVFSLSVQNKGFYRGFFISLPPANPPSSQSAEIAFSSVEWDNTKKDFVEKFVAGVVLKEGECQLVRLIYAGGASYVAVKLDDIRYVVNENILDLTLSEDVPCNAL